MDTSKEMTSEMPVDSSTEYSTTEPQVTVEKETENCEYIPSELEETKKVKKRKNNKRNKSKNQKKSQSNRISYKRTKLNSNEYKRVKTDLRSIERDSVALKDQFKQVANISSIMYRALHVDLNESEIDILASVVANLVKDKEVIGTDAFDKVEDRIKLLVITELITRDILAMDVLLANMRTVRQAINSSTADVETIFDVNNSMVEMMAIGAYMLIYHSRLKSIFVDNNELMLDKLNILGSSRTRTVYEAIRALLELKDEDFEPKSVVDELNGTVTCGEESNESAESSAL